MDKYREWISNMSSEEYEAFRRPSYRDETEDFKIIDWEKPIIKKSDYNCMLGKHVNNPIRYIKKTKGQYCYLCEVYIGYCAGNTEITTREYDKYGRSYNMDGSYPSIENTSIKKRDKVEREYTDRTDKKQLKFKHTYKNKSLFKEYWK